MQTLSFSRPTPLATLMAALVLGALPSALLQLGHQTSVRLYTESSGISDDRGSGRVTLNQPLAPLTFSHHSLAFRGSGRIDDGSIKQESGSTSQARGIQLHQASTALAFRGSGRIGQMGYLKASTLTSS